MGLKDPAYDALHRQATDLQHQINNKFDDRSHPTANRLQHEVQQLRDDLELGKRPRDIENRIKTIQHGLHEAANQTNSFMSQSDAHHFYRTYKEMGENMRKFKDYS